MKGILILPIVAVLVSASSPERIVQKRQIYREEVLPHAGGKIPDTAFQTDRLFLNHLQKEGFSIPDGIILEQRNPQVYPFLNKQMRMVYKVALSSDGRYTPDVGRYRTDYPPSVETTYLVPQIHNHPDQVLPNTPAYPVYRQLQIQNPLLNQPKLQPKKKSLLYISQYHNKNNGSGPEKIKANKPEVHAINLLNDPFNTLSDNVFVQNQEASHLFNEFDNLFNGLQLDSMRSYQFKTDRSTSKKMKI